MLIQYRGREVPACDARSSRRNRSSETAEPNIGRAIALRASDAAPRVPTAVVQLRSGRAVCSSRGILILVIQ